ncbi:MAG: glycosyltransferase [Nitrospinae bacterium]|nr:glycosyltransferase [Nitrospinota bacterium]
MKILSFNWHTPYLSLLAGLRQHTFEIAPANLEASFLKPWDEAMRPMPENVSAITKEEARERLSNPGYYDLMIAHNVKDIVMAKDFALPKILVFHNRLSTEAELGKKPEIVKDYREWVRQLVSGVYCVFISETKRHDWGIPGEIIMPGIDTSLYGGYTGENPVVLRIGNNLKVRDLMTGYSVQEEALADLANVIFGMNADIPASRLSSGWDELKEAYRRNRLFINTTMAPWEDGYNLAMLESMATGMPVLTLENPTCPLTDGVDGFVGATAADLRARAQRLLEDLPQAKSIGAEGRKTVERLFPISAFHEKWAAAIGRAMDWSPKPPGVIFPAAGTETPRRRFAKKHPAGKNVLLSYTSYPITAAAYIERAFRTGHDVVTAGGRINDRIVNMWNLHNMRGEIKTHDIPTPDLTGDMDFILPRLPQGFKPDFLLWVETGLGRAPVNLHKLDIPKAAYLIDTHVHPERDIENSRGFDVVFVAQRAYIPLFQAAGVKNVHWLPLACDPEIHGKRPMEKTRDVGFVGSLTDERRVKLLMRLAEKMDVQYGRLFLREMADFFCGSKIVFNNAIKNDLNMRVFESMCAGAMLLTDNADGLTDFFRDKAHLVIYGDGDIVDLAGHYLAHDTERDAIAEAGRREVLEKHTYAHRVAEIVKVMGGL